MTRYQGVFQTTVFGVTTFCRGKIVENSFTTVATMDSAWPVAMFVQEVNVCKQGV